MITANANIKDGKLILSNPKRLAEDLRQHKDCVVELIIKKKARRSTPQNRYMWGVVYKELEIRMKQLGNDVNPDVVHEFCKERFNPIPIVDEDGEAIATVGGSTAKMNKEEFGIYLDKIIFFAAETLGITIPLPDKNLSLMFAEYDEELQITIIE